MTAAAFVALILFLFPLAYSPGPGNTFFAAIGASRGLRAAIPALIGYHGATFLVTALVGFGLGGTVLTSPVFVTVLSAAGSVYVLWLAFTFIRAARSRESSSESSAPTQPTRNIGAWSGAIVLLLNPKAYYIIVVMFTQFLGSQADGDVAGVLLITTIFTVNNLIAFVVWTLGGRMLTALFRSARAQRIIDYVFAATLIGVAIWMALPLFGLG